MDLRSSNDEDVVLEVIVATSLMVGEMEEEEGGSEEFCFARRVGSGQKIERDFEGTNEMLLHHYFSADYSLYYETVSECRFGSSKGIINYIIEGLEGCAPFVQKRDVATWRLGILLQAFFVATLRILKSEDFLNHHDEHLQLSEK